MTALLDRLIRIRRPRPGPAVAPGVYAYERESDGRLARLHLRADADSGVLVINATVAARLSAAGVFLARQLLEGNGDDDIVRQTVRTFSGARPAAVQEDLDRLRALIDGIGDHGDAYPVINLADANFAGHTSVLDKPIAADVPLARPERIEPLLRRLWDEAIPHVVVVLPAKFEHAGLCRVIELAGDLGMIAGVRGTATSLAGGTLLDELAQAGVDHVNVLCLSSDAALNDRLLERGDHAAAATVFARLLENEVCPVAEIALLEDNLPGIEDTLDWLAVRGVRNVAFFALATDGPADADHYGALTPDDLLQTAATVEEMLERFDLNGTWYAPVLRDPRVPLDEQIRRGPRASGDNAIRVKANGDVYAARGPADRAGNLLEQEWEDIQNGTVYARYVQRVTTPTHCEACPGLVICAADCPRSRPGWSNDLGGAS